MTKIKKRNQEILKRHEQGIKVPDIAYEFRLSRSRIQFILKEFEQEEQIQKKSRQLQEQIKNTNDLDHQWHKSDLIDMLKLPAMTRSGLLNNNVNGNDSSTISLREFLDLVICDTDDQCDTSCTSPVLHVRTIGKKGFRAMVERFTNLDLGASVKEEWEQRIALLSRRNKTRSCPYCGRLF